MVMYEKKINILNQFDRELSHESFRYNVIFASLTVVIIFMLLFIKKSYILILKLFFIFQSLKKKNGPKRENFIP